MRTSQLSGLRWVAVVTAAVLVVVVAFLPSDSDRGSPGIGRPEVVGLAGGAPVLLQADRSCDAVLGDFRALAPQVLADQLAATADIATAGGDGAVAESSDDAGARAAAPAADSAEGAGTAGGGTSDTNTQEEGIDEPDVVETDGDHVYLVDMDQLLVLDGATAEVVGRLRLAGHGAQIMKSGDRILAITGGGAWIGGPEVLEPGVAVDAVGSAVAVEEPAPQPAEPEPQPAEPEPRPAEDAPAPLPVEPPSFAPGTVMQLVDVSDPASPSVVETTEIEGNHVSTRVVDGVARVVITSYPQPRVLFEQPTGSGDDPVEAMARRAEETTVEDWLPEFRTTVANDGGVAEPVEGPAVACESVLMPEVNAGLAETSILRVDLRDGFDPQATTTIVAEAGTVYASATTLYVAATRYVSPAAMDDVAAEDWSTAVHAFDLRGDGPAVHVGAGEVPGSTLNQYSLSEHDGHLRIATTEGTPWGGGPESESAVRVLELQGDQLVQIGMVGGLGRTETIQSVRFMGPVGYVVTFRQTDPLYVIDLADPRDPRAVGELKIPGFSSYLHPVGEGRLVGVGRDATLDGQDQGLLVSLFDVSDPTDPRQIQTYTERNAHSAAGFDPKAFLWWGAESAAVMPVERYGAIDERTGAQEFSSGMLVLEVADSGIAERALVTAGERYPSRSLVVQGRLWSLFDGAVVTSGFDGTGGALHPLR